ncbi:MAG: hypothetical protein CL938_07145 [Deltaproteobacteria bacterium]|nr:hypothetical protein [Deltaproteobacteria bacterium]
MVAHGGSRRAAVLASGSRGGGDGARQAAGSVDAATPAGGRDARGAGPGHGPGLSGRGPQPGGGGLPGPGRRPGGTRGTARRGGRGRRSLPAARGGASGWATPLEQGMGGGRRCRERGGYGALRSRCPATGRTRRGVSGWRFVVSCFAAW